MLRMRINCKILLTLYSIALLLQITTKKCNFMMRIEKRQFDERIEAELVDLAYRHGANAAHEEQAVYVEVAA